MSDLKRVAIIGAGMAGLTLARALGGHAAVRIFEKSKAVGGRMATRRIDDVSFDHGAQYFTIRDPRFRDMLDAAADDGVMARWGADIVSLPILSSDDRSPVDTARERDPRYVGTPHMTSVPSWMARTCDVAFDTEVASIRHLAGAWVLQTHAGDVGPFDWVIATAPAPQAAALLPETFTHRKAVLDTAMNACFTLMVTLRSGADTPFAAARLEDPVINWISRNDRKPGRGARPCLVVNARPDWSDAHLSDPLNILRQNMLAALRRHVPLDDDEADSAILKRWRYANVARPAGQPFLLDSSQRLACCGDWCIAGRVEAAFQSATRLADALVPLLKEPAE
ncbi:NAD(P)/FAD-dependent oxidoreductase [Rhizobium sp. Leaf341]|uniref:NAD(P)/FAD-dependent oxidoreductase n=1 Tax=Rhizobium sp. Leaf341 TaxID=1736344 RepID=UPI000713AC63|nr:FAD-dependent oxidoreductase [Rhizobium sp. Leaf341]KQR71685.1 hypothetical protein ASG03_04250 [Rhizobium sp. Leaf341]